VVGELLQHVHPRLAERATGKARAEEVARLRELRGRQAGRHLDDPVLDQAADRDQHDERAAGAEIDPDTPRRMPNTLDAHRLTHWAGLEGRQTAVVSAIMRAYWREGRDIGNAGVLADIAAAAGMDRAVTARLLASDADADDIRARDADARAKGVTAVPTFLIAQQYVVSGAQPPEVWGRVIEELVEKAKAAD